MCLECHKRLHVDSAESLHPVSPCDSTPSFKGTELALAAWYWCSQGGNRDTLVCLRTTFSHMAAPVPLAECLRWGRERWSRGRATGKAALRFQGTTSVFPVFTKDTQETQWLITARKYGTQNLGLWEKGTGRPGEALAFWEQALGECRGKKSKSSVWGETHSLHQKEENLVCHVKCTQFPSNRRREQRCWTAQGFSWSFLKFNLLLELKPGFCQPLSRGGGRNFSPYLQVGFKYYILNQNSIIWQIYFLLRPTLKYIKSLCFPPL